MKRSRSLPTATACLCLADTATGSSKQTRKSPENPTDYVQKIAVIGLSGIGLVQQEGDDRFAREVHARRLEVNDMKRQQASIRSASTP